jgi:hypothetical protein
MATYRLDIDVEGELVFIEEENGSFRTPAPQAPWENDSELLEPSCRQRSHCTIGVAA